MNRRVRLVMIAASAALLGTVMLIGFGGLPAFGHAHELYGLVVNGVELSERHATDTVTALNFDLRGFDTLGEEFILFASVAGVALLLRELRDEHAPAQNPSPDERRFGQASDSVRALSVLLVPLLVVLGAYVIVHGQLTPGGGFQGGVVLAAGPLAIMFAGRYVALKAIAPSWALEAIDSIGAASYALIGLGGMIFATAYLNNFLPLGTAGHLLSAGIMPLNSLAVGVEVTGAFLLAWTEFLDQALLVRDGEGESEPQGSDA